MRRRFLFLRLYEHLAYCGLLLLIFWFFQQREKEQVQFQQSWEYLLPPATEEMTWVSNARVYDIQRSAYSNPIRPVLKHTRSAENISELAKSLTRQLESAAHRPKEQYDTLLHMVTAVRALGDTILQNTRPDTSMAKWVEAVLQGTDILLQAWPDTCSDAERARFCRYLQLRVAVLESGALAYFKEKIDVLEPEWGVVPQLSISHLNPSCPVVGDLFEADIFASLYKKHDLFHAATINGQEYPVENGLVRFRKQFSTPGRHILDIRLTLQGEEAGAVPRHYVKAFEVQVCPR